MENHSSSSRASQRYSRSVVFPRIKTDQRHTESPRSSRESFGKDFGQSNSKDQSDELDKYILERLDLTERALETERRERGILDEHVRSLMSHLQRLNKDMAALQQQVKLGESSPHSQSMPALKNLEMHQVSGIGDIWNRLTLGDLNTIKLSGDLNKLSGDVADIKRGQEHGKDNLDKLSKDLHSLATKVEKSSSEFDKNFQMLKFEVDSKVSSLERNLEVAAKWNEKMEKRNQESGGNDHARWEFENQYLQALKNFELRFDQFMEKHELWKEGINKNISIFNEDLLQVKGTYEGLTRRIDDVRTNQRKEVERSHEGMKDSYREAFRAVYESITTMQTVLEAKLKMTEADLKTSINSILKTIAQ
jgi:hypothetical protein